MKQCEYVFFFNLSGYRDRKVALQGQVGAHKGILYIHWPRIPYTAQNPMVKEISRVESCQKSFPQIRLGPNWAAGA